jgi:SAM-dependent methyltransferase
MFRGNMSHYFGTGGSALSVILNVLQIAEELSPESILDFGCGAGRVTRWLVSAFQNSLIEGCDIRQVDINFVASEFNIRTWLSSINIDQLKSEKKYDLIWVGSIFTHLDAKDSTKLLAKLYSWLNTGGVLIFSTHGRFVEDRFKSESYGLLMHDIPKIIEAYKHSGYGYADYPQESGYGISLSSLTWWINKIGNLEKSQLVLITEQIWDFHHDVIAVRKI